jgi:prepilin-type N-terminal cleavage/methylation domain-containing protein
MSARLVNRERRGFTLVEVLVAMAVFLVMMVFIVSILGSVHSIWRTGSVRADNFMRARLALGLVHQDLSLAVLGQGYPAFVAGEEAAFPSAREGFRPGAAAFGDRPLSWVAYRLETNPASPQFGLQRGDRGFNFTDDAQAFQGTNAATVPSPELVYPAGAFHHVGPGVLRFDLRFQRNDGVLTNGYAYDPENPTAPGNTPVAVATLLVVDEGTAAFLQNSGRLGDFLIHFPEPPEGTDAAQTWSTPVESGTALALLPNASKSGVRVFRRTVLLPHETRP